MIRDMILVLEGEIAAIDTERPLTTHLWIQRRRLRKASRLLRLYVADDNTPDTYTEGGPR